ncbi:MAG: extracellular solute-binding protein [Lachnospiraceae bacterium]
MKKKLLSTLLCVSMVAASLVGCGAPKETAPAESAAPAATEAAPAATEAAPATDAAAPAAGLAIEDGAELVYWSMWGETEPQGKVIQEAIDAFTEETGVKVEAQFGSRETRKTLQPALDAGETIDIFDEDIERVNNTWGNYLMTLDDLYAASGLDGKLNATMIDLAKKVGGGSLKAIPYQPSTFVVLYNKDIFNEAKITAVPKTWDEFLAACEAIKASGKIPLTVDDAYMAAFFGYMMDRTIGFDATAKIAADKTFTDPAVLKTAEAIQVLVEKGYIDPKAAGNVYPAGQSDIANGSVAMYLNGTWLPNEIKGQAPADFNWGAMALPGPIADGGDGGESNQFGSQCFAINKDSKYPNAAFAFIQYMVTGEWDQKLADESMGVPMANDAVWPVQLADAKAVLDSTTNRLSWAVGMEDDADVNAKLKTNLAKMIEGSMDAKGFAAAMQK